MQVICRRFLQVALAAPAAPQSRVPTTHRRPSTRGAFSSFDATDLTREVSRKVSKSKVGKAQSVASGWFVISIPRRMELRGFETKGSHVAWKESSQRLFPLPGGAAAAAAARSERRRQSKIDDDPTQPPEPAIHSSKPCTDVPREVHKPNDLLGFFPRCFSKVLN